MAKKETFKVFINDGYCTWAFPVELTENHSIDDVAKGLYKGLGLKAKKGEYIEKYKNENYDI
tara:strand:+ start:14944 stop:15129 length:186 start_codon:yes stop_codon:yes gene_type:complete